MTEQTATGPQDKQSTDAWMRSRNQQVQKKEDERRVAELERDGKVRPNNFDWVKS